jgi:hypothetical protein
MQLGCCVQQTGLRLSAGALGTPHTNALLWMMWAIEHIQQVHTVPGEHGAQVRVHGLKLFHAQQSTRYGALVADHHKRQAQPLQALQTADGSVL